MVVIDAWTIDCPDHGESASLNEAVLKHRDPLGESFQRSYATKRETITFDTAPIHYAKTVIALFQSGLLSTCARSSKIILVGHCGGAISA